MAVLRATAKGQVFIPAPLRKKYKIVKGTLLNIYDEENRIVLEPIHQDPVSAGRGRLKTGGRVLKALMRDRRREAKR